MKMAHVQMQLRRISRAGALGTVPRTLELFQAREQLYGQVLESEWGRGKTTAQVKQLFNSIIYGGEVKDDSGLPEFVMALATEQKTLREAEAAAHPKLLAKLVGKRDPVASLQYFLNEHDERLVVDIMVHEAALIKVKPWAFEHDGIPGDKAMLKIKDTLEFAGIEVAEKPVPGNWKELRAVLAQDPEASIPGRHRGADERPLGKGHCFPQGQVR